MTLVESINNMVPLVAVITIIFYSSFLAEFNKFGDDIMADTFP